MPAQGYSGRLLRLAIGDGGEPESFQLIAGLRTTALLLDNAPLDVTTVASEGFRMLMPDGGLQSLSVSGEGLVTDAAADRLLYLQAVNRTLARYRLTFGNDDVFEGPFAVSRFQRSGAQAEAESFSITLESAGDIDFLAGGEGP